MAADYKIPGGWAVFAAVILLIVGSLNFMFGMAGILNDQVVTVGGQGVIIWDFETWGWIHLVVGAIMVLVSLGLFATREWAAVLAIIFAAISAIAQIGLITAFPLWSILIIVLDVLVIYNLTRAPWKPAT